MARCAPPWRGAKNPLRVFLAYGGALPKCGRESGQLCWRFVRRREHFPGYPLRRPKIDHGGNSWYCNWLRRVLRLKRGFLCMEIAIHLPDDIVESLAWQDIPRHLLEQIALEGYQTGR